MCGIAGFFSPNTAASNKSVLHSMLQSIEHRGPDDAGQWHSSDEQLHLGHRRLSIIDLSPTGKQPMESASGRYVLTFNGEIYNYRPLQHQLQKAGVMFRGASDTEVLLALIEANGLQAALSKCTGMFALALWDKKTATLQLARDRFGEKPLYYSWQKDTLIFGSELKALAQHPHFERRIDAESLQLYCRFGYINAPLSIYAKTRKLPAGTTVSFALGEAERPSQWPDPKAYWSQEETLLNGLRHATTASFDEASAELEQRLLAAVRQQMHADVPLGAFLSGGIDSSLVVALMQTQASRPVKSYAIGFESIELSEAKHARAVAEHLQTDHTEYVVTGQDALELIPSLPQLYDEPLADASAIPTTLLARLARRDVTVALTGDGGDELFFGYPKYFGFLKELEKSRSTSTTATAMRLWRGLASIAAAFGPKTMAKVESSYRRSVSLHGLAISADARHTAGILFAHQRNYRNPCMQNVGANHPVFDAPLAPLLRENPNSLAMFLDRQSYLPDDILMKVDRATMAASLESRAPLLDHNIAQFAATLPADYLKADNDGKQILKDVLYRHVPRSLVDRPKSGFSAPMADWLRDDLYEWAQDLLHSNKASEHLDLHYCRTLLDEHKQNYKNHEIMLWAILSAIAWMENWL